MNLRFLLDTNVVSRLARTRPPLPVLARLEEHGGSCAISAITIEELFFGAMTGPDDCREALMTFVEIIEKRFPVLPYDADAARQAARLREQLMRKQRTIAHPDVCVAAVACSRGLTVITNNRRHFDVFDGLTVEDWEAG